MCYFVLFYLLVLPFGNELEQNQLVIPKSVEIPLHDVKIAAE